MPSPSSSGVPFTLGLGTSFDTLLGLSTLQRMYDTLPPGHFPDAALERLNVAIDEYDLDRVPADGPVVVVANHPTGALDGLVLLSTLRRRRADVRVLGNQWLTRIPEMRAWTIPVNPFRACAKVNVRGLREARRWVEGGGALVVFPSGAVARETDDESLAVDEPWHEGVLALLDWTDAPVVPAHLSGRSSAWFRALSRLHPALGTILLPRELLRQRGVRVSVRYGRAIDAARLQDLSTPGARLAYLRARVQGLAPSQRSAHSDALLAPTVIPSLLKGEIESLPGDCQLGSSRDLAVYHATAARIPHTLREIGRLRERTFRAAGEGTGRAIDLDGFDDSYLHLFLWNRAKAEIVGAYRLCPSDGHRAAPALYSESLFHWRRRPGIALGPSIELGRSFVREEYQRDPAALLMLWKGIGAFVARHPGYRRLFGPVSISADYHPVSRELMAAWLSRYAADPAPVTPRHAVRCRPDVRTLVDSGALATVADLDQLVREIEGGRGLPVLLRQYLRLNGRVLAQSHDPDFGDVVDALVVVDLLEMPANHLERYCGVEGAARVRRTHRRPATNSPPHDTRVASVSAMASSL
jgi:putative hemolysin